jgi:hypothetical protein
MPSIGRMVLFFIVIKDIIQLLAWMKIFGEIKIKSKMDRKKGIVYDTDKLLKNESNFIEYLVKYIYYKAHNFFIILYHSFTRFHYALFFSFLNLIKATPFYIHGYF